jgi:hypothetical protein
MPFYQRRGDVPRKRHVQFRENGAPDRAQKPALVGGSSSADLALVRAPWTSAFELPGAPGIVPAMVPDAPDGRKPIRSSRQRRAATLRAVKAANGHRKRARGSRSG